jgi:hypothetical protein
LKRIPGLDSTGARGAFAAAVFALTLAGAANAQTVQLVTPQEAALPPGPTPSLEFRGSPLRRPSVELVSPAPAAGTVRSPLELKLRFRAFGGAEVDPDSVVVTYLKTPAVNLTPRVAPYIKADGIDIDRVELPAGDHQFWVELKDKNGRAGAAAFTVQVAP